MSIWKLVRLKFGPNVAHFGELGIGLEETSERLRSDTLFSAWISTYAKMFGKDAVAELLQQFNSESPPFALSSTFIYQQLGKKLIYYLPRPLKFPFGYPIGKDLDFTKAYKGLNYLPLEVWQRWYQKEGFTESDRTELIDKVKGKSNGDLSNTGSFDYQKTFELSKIPKIAVDRTTRATNLYHTGFVQYKENVGLYFLVAFSNPNLENTFFTVLRFLGEEGIGGERSSGAGQFKVEEETDPNQLKHWEQLNTFSCKNPYYSLISLFWESPLSPDFLDVEGNLPKESSYELQKRGGWISASPSGSQRRRQSVQMFTEGSVFPVKPRGKLADVTPDGFNVHRVYRSGISLSLPIKVQD